LGVKNGNERFGSKVEELYSSSQRITRSTQRQSIKFNFFALFAPDFTISAVKKSLNIY
jgi:hypothetical protein